jgi:hypothetical protein
MPHWINATRPENYRRLFDMIDICIRLSRIYILLHPTPDTLHPNNRHSQYDSSHPLPLY